ncbi:hypothetical protein PTNB73_00738 [Pyrenophora teres f. teres]|nr:hypothetical protein HRS9139_01983 [Pyrenophora teres f. teres]KAE8851721.1 hypothetical protein HRS9122_02008 [Pyrenophora teres f. teres]KAE8874106.1 hypothetical protein PTNB73_00738 [Pyrenophora teres f. teres]
MNTNMYEKNDEASVPETHQEDDSVLQNTGGDDEKDRNEHSLPTPPPSAKRPKTDRHEAEVAPIEFSVSRKEPELFLKLRDDYTNGLTWSNHPRDLAITTYFDPKKELTLGDDFNIEGLRPVLREESPLDRFLLVDNVMRWYIFDQGSDRLRWINGEDLDECETNEEKADFIVCELGNLCVQPVSSDHHPAENRGLEDDIVPVEII